MGLFVGADCPTIGITPDLRLGHCPLTTAVTRAMAASMTTYSLTALGRGRSADDPSWEAGRSSPVSPAGKRVGDSPAGPGDRAVRPGDVPAGPVDCASWLGNGLGARLLKAVMALTSG